MTTCSSLSSPPSWRPACALLRRGQGQPAPALTLGGLVFDRSTGTATLHGRPLELRRREWAVLESLMMRAGKVVTKERLSTEVFGHDEPVGPNALEVYVDGCARSSSPTAPSSVPSVASATCSTPHEDTGESSSLTTRLVVAMAGPLLALALVLGLGGAG
ncbi:winged helix-turn-helix domain-containing protein [Cystobacter fuscus]